MRTFTTFFLTWEELGDNIWVAKDVLTDGRIIIKRPTTDVNVYHANIHEEGKAGGYFLSSCTDGILKLAWKCVAIRLQVAITVSSSDRLKESCPIYHQKCADLLLKHTSAIINTNETNQPKEAVGYDC